MSKWTVFEVAKRLYMATGIVPDRKELRRECKGVESRAITEGLRMFKETIGG